MRIVAWPLLSNLLYVFLPGAVEGQGEIPACWVNWQVNITEDGITREGDACEEFVVVTILNVAIFFGIFWMIVRFAVHQTQ
eukprot:symbB.v1.2.008135.t1/scaffold509.1/size193965/5